MPTRALQEIVDTEAAYVKDLQLLCGVYLARARGQLSKEQELHTFSNVETLLKISEELLRSLREKPGDVAAAAAAFGSLAPYLRAYSEYCANFITAQELLERLRSQSSALDKALSDAEQTGRQPIGSILIKPVQARAHAPSHPRVWPR